MFDFILMKGKYRVFIEEKFSGEDRYLLNNNGFMFNRMLIEIFYYFGVLVGIY